MYSTGPDIGSIVLMFVFAAISLLVLYFIIKAAVTEGMKEHTRWQVANRAEIEAKYGKKPGTPPPAS